MEVYFHDMTKTIGWLRDQGNRDAHGICDSQVRDVGLVIIVRDVGVCEITVRRGTRSERPASVRITSPTRASYHDR